MKKILVTGATGFVGSHIIENLMGRDDVKIIAACRSPEKLPKGYTGEVRQGDLLDPHYVTTVTQDVDVVCHAAAWTSAWNHAAESRRLFLAPSLDLIEKAVRNKVKRFIFLSSTSVAAPYASADTMSVADEKYLKLWPHMRNVARIEHAMRKNASQHCQMTSLRVGLFIGERYGIGMLPLLVPRLKTHLVPWVNGGTTRMPLIAGKDIGKAFSLACHAKGLSGFLAINIIGPHSPTVRQVIEFLSTRYGLPKPHFSVPFPLAYVFARLMELLDPVVPWEPLVTRSIVHLLEETRADNKRAEKLLGFTPQIHWKDAVQIQMAEMTEKQKKPMKMAKPIP